MAKPDPIWIDALADQISDIKKDLHDRQEVASMMFLNCPDRSFQALLGVSKAERREKKKDISRIDTHLKVCRCYCRSTLFGILLCSLAATPAGQN